jgi:hypothetical protein
MTTHVLRRLVKTLLTLVTYILSLIIPPLYNQTIRYLVKSLPRKSWRYQRDNQKPFKRTDHIMTKEKGQTTIYKTLHIELQIKQNNPTINRGRRVSRSCSTRRVSLVTHPVIGHEWGKDRSVLMTKGTYPRLFLTQIFCNDGDRKAFERMTSA